MNRKRNKEKIRTKREPIQLVRCFVLFGRDLEQKWKINKKKKRQQQQQQQTTKTTTKPKKEIRIYNNAHTHYTQPAQPESHTPTRKTRTKKKCLLPVNSIQIRMSRTTHCEIETHIPSSSSSSLPPIAMHVYRRRCSERKKNKNAGSNCFLFCGVLCHRLSTMHDMTNFIFFFFLKYFFVHRQFSLLVDFYTLRNTRHINTYLLSFRL